jgi:hypothetical protein
MLFHPEIVVANCAPDALVFNLAEKRIHIQYNIEYYLKIYHAYQRVAKRCRL